jgi:glycosyltransferase involved in cell wall biosynthesis
MTNHIPVLSAIVISQNNEATIERTLRSIVSQVCPFPFEVILVNSGSDGTVEIAQQHFPQVRVVRLSPPALPGRARNAGLNIALGRYVSFPGSHVELAAGSLSARVAAHEQGFAMVTGAICNGTLTPSGWASYFMDHSTSLPGRPSGPLDVHPNSCSYDRAALLACGLFSEDRRAGEDTVVNQRLWAAGHRAFRDNRILLTHKSRCTTPWRLMRHHFVRGRAFGRILAERGEKFSFLDGYTSRRLSRIAADVDRWGGELNAEMHRCWRLIRLGVMSAHLGARFEMLLRSVR